MIYVVATLELNEGKREEFLAAQKSLLPLVRAEAGCIEYAPTVDIALTDPPKNPVRDNVIVMHERWETLDHLKAHAVAPHMKDFRGVSKGMVKSLKVEAFETV